MKYDNLQRAQTNEANQANHSSYLKRRFVWCMHVYVTSLMDAKQTTTLLPAKVKAKMNVQVIGVRRIRGK